MNRSTVFHFLKEETELELWSTKVGKWYYNVFSIPWKWETSYLFINNSRIRDFRDIVLFNKEMVIRFSNLTEEQINIPYKDIWYLDVEEEVDVRLVGILKRKKEMHHED